MEYVTKMQLIRHPMTLTQLWLKVVEITQETTTPLQNNILGWGWLQWFRKRNPNLLLWVIQGLEIGHAKSLCLANVESLYKNLSEAYEVHTYPPSQNWKCDEFNGQIDQMEVPWF